MVCPSYAKLNLFLAVLAQRPDRYHNLKTIFERIDLCDTIILKKRKDGRITVRCAYPGVPTDASNLCYRSAALLQADSRCRDGADIFLKKKIPPAAGLGGGSSNAASVLEGLNKLWGIHYSRRKLLCLGRKIGADVPFFLYKTSFALGRGRGDRITPLNIPAKPPLWHLIVVPQVTVSTPLIYKAWDRKNTALPGTLADTKMLTKRRGNVKLITQYIIYLRKREISRFGDFLFNDLEPVTVSLYPEVQRIKRLLKSLGISAVMMSGSGPSVFAMLRSRKEAETLARTLKGKNASWKIFTARTI